MPRRKQAGHFNVLQVSRACGASLPWGEGCVESALPNLSQFSALKKPFVSAGRGVSSPKWTRVGSRFCPRYLPAPLGLCVYSCPRQRAEGGERDHTQAAGQRRGWSVVSTSSPSPFKASFNRISFSALEGLLCSGRLQGLRKSLRLFTFPLCGNLLGRFLQPAPSPP